MQSLLLLYKQLKDSFIFVDIHSKFNNNGKNHLQMSKGLEC